MLCEAINLNRKRNEHILQGLIVERSNPSNVIVLQASSPPKMQSRENLMNGSQEQQKSYAYATSTNRLPSYTGQLSLKSNCFPAKKIL